MERHDVRPNPTLTKRQCLLFFLVVLLGIGLRVCRLDFPNSNYFDEKYYVSAADDYLENRDDANSVHPPLAKIQIAAGMLALDGLKAKGYNTLPDTVAWRFSSCLAGIAVLFLSFRLALTVTRNASVALLTTLFVAVDFLEIVESRITMLDEIQSAWILLGLVWCADYVFRERRNLHLWGAGLAFGCATACKWNGLFAAVGGFLALLYACSPEHRLLHRLKVGVIFALTIVLVYAASYTPFLLREGVSQASFNKIVGFHQRMVKFRYDPKQFKHRYISQFWEWPLVMRPIWFYYEEIPISTARDAPKKVFGICGFGNVFFWWPAFFLLLEGLYFGVRHQERATNFLSCCYFPQWLLWASSTTGGFIYYMLPMVPLMALAVSRHVQLWFQDPKTRWVAILYVVVLLGLAAIYYPLLTGLPVSEAYFRHTFFVSKWI